VERGMSFSFYNIGCSIVGWRRALSCYDHYHLNRRTGQLYEI